MKIELAVYDLSNGLAAQMSQAILGQYIEGIWHTGVVVFNRGGIQNLSVGAFSASNGLRAVRQLHIGDTTKTKIELEQFLSTINHRFTQATYDLINNNCNNFSNEVCQFLCNRGIPSYIVDLPRIVFSTPGGAMLRPMIEGMQNGINQRNHPSALDPFGSGGGGGTSGYADMTWTAASAPAPAANSSIRIDSSREAISAQLKPAPPPTMSAPDIDLAHGKPLVSGDRDPAMLSNLVAKIFKFVTDDFAANPQDEALSSLASQRSAVEEAVSAVASYSQDSFPSACCEFLLRVFLRYPKLEMSCLFITRLLVLINREISGEIVRPMVLHLLGRLKRGDDGFSTCPAMVMAFCTLANLLSHKEGCVALFGTNTVEALSLSSALVPVEEQSASASVSPQELGDMLVDVAMWGLAHSKVEVRQISGALAYNISLACTAWSNSSVEWRSLHVMGSFQEPKEKAIADAQDLKACLANAPQPGGAADDNADLHQHVVQMMCGTLENISDETDAVALRRKMLIAYRVCRAGGGQARQLAVALGFDAIICEIHHKMSPKGGDDHKLSSSLVNMLT